MALYKEQDVLPKLLKSPADWIYLFASDSFISHLSGAYRQTVYKKNILQRKYVNTWAQNCGATFEAWRSQIGDAIKNTYGMTAQEVLVRLASGQNVAGKNWKEGVYGIAGNKYEAFTQNTSITVDASTGKLMQGGSEITGQTAVYSSNGKTVEGYTVSLDGKTYQSMRTGSQYYAGTYSTSEGAFNADGSAYNPTTCASIFQNMTAWFPFIQSFVSWIMSIMNIAPIQASTVVARQDDWIKTTNDKDTWLYFVAGAAIIALLMKK